MFMRVKAEYPLYINSGHVVEIYTDHNGHWQASLSNSATVDLTEWEARQLLGVTSMSFDIKGAESVILPGPAGDSFPLAPPVPYRPPAGPVGFGAEMQAL